MSLQDETFPEDEFLDGLNFSPTSAQFPHPKQKADKHSGPMSASTSTNTSASSAISEPADDAPKKPDHPNDLTSSSHNTANQSTDDDSYEKKPLAQDQHHHHSEGETTKGKKFLDIHSAYTKRRYQHVHSKVAVYIANLKAEDEQRQKQQAKKKKFQRHQSMPETLSDVTVTGGGGGGRGNVTSSQKLSHAAAFYSAGELHKMFTEFHSSDGDIDVSENSERPPSSCNEMSSSDCVERIQQMLHEIERLEAYNEGLHGVVEEKTSQVACLKRNIHQLRIELCKCQDQLKLKTRQAGSIFGSGHHLGGVRCCTKGTQTDYVPPEMQQVQPRIMATPAFNRSVVNLYVTPETPDNNNNKNDNRNHNNNNNKLLNKFGLIIEGATPTRAGAPSKFQLSRMQFMIEGEDEIQVAESVEMTSYKSVVDAGTSTTTQTAAGQEQQQQQQHKPLNDSDMSNEITSAMATTTTTDMTTTPASAARRKRKALKSLFSIFRPCVGCRDPNETLPQQSYTQVPLLETSML